MDQDVPLHEQTCRWCARTFYVCRRDYRGQEYCKDDCRDAGAAASHRQASARYVRSLGEDGRRAEREHIDLAIDQDDRWTVRWGAIPLGRLDEHRLDRGLIPMRRPRGPKRVTSMSLL